MVERKFFGNCQKNFGRAAKTGFHTNISQKNTDSEKSLFHLNFGHRAEQFLPLLTFFRVGLSRSPSTCPLENFEGFFWFFSSFLYQSRTLIEKKSGFFLKTFRRNFQNCILGVRGKTLGKYFLFKILFFHPFWTMSQKLSAFWQIFYGGVLKTTFYVSTKTVWELFCEKKLIFHHFWTLIGKIYASFLKSFGGVVKTAFHLSTGTFRGVFLEKVLFHHFWTLLESC